MTYIANQPQQIYLFNGSTGIACYAAGTQICVNCPLPPYCCDSSCSDTTRLRKVVRPPICLRDYVIWKLYPFIRPAASQEIGDDIARRTLALGMSDKAFKRAVDIYADRKKFMAELEKRKEAA